ncbi:MAG TPA: S53 family peptidase, partial [Gemmataceae bacterium]|nr:S53 family peptidase [Gemmataceae bacterium]
MLSSFWRKWMRGCSTPSFQRKRPSSSRPVRLILESLESRDLLSATTTQVATPFYEIYQPQGSAGPMGTPGPTGYSPSQISQAYGFNQLSFSNNGTAVAANGAGETIAIVDAYNDPTIASDLQAFDKQFGLPNPNLSILNENGGTTLPGVDPTGGWELEESLDVEWAHAMAPGANIVFIEANSDSYSDLLTGVQTAAAMKGVVAVSMSWGGGEWSGETSLDSDFVAPSSNPGVVFIASSGDSGAPPSYPAVSPNVLAVGGTTLNLSSSGTYESESAWAGSGGGISAYEPLPSYQPGTYSNGTSTGTSTTRMNPDVSYDANPSTGFPVYDSYNYGTT